MIFFSCSSLSFRSILKEKLRILPFHWNRNSVLISPNSCNAFCLKLIKSGLFSSVALLISGSTADIRITFTFIVNTLLIHVVLFINKSNLKLELKTVYSTSVLSIDLYVQLLSNLQLGASWRNDALGALI